MASVSSVGIECFLRLLDLLYIFFRRIHKSKPRIRDDAEINALSDEEIMNRVKQLSPLPNSNNRVYKFSENLVIKCGYRWRDIEAESISMKLVQNQTDIRSPRLLRVIDYRGRGLTSGGAIIMEWIPNAKSILDVWPKFSLWRRLFILLELRYYVRQIRNIEDSSSFKPGPPGPEFLKCSGFTFGPDGGIRIGTQEELLDYFEHNYARTMNSGGSNADGLEPLPLSKILPLVFTHNDLHPSNILIDDQYRVWIIDWGNAGFYPPFFEYTTTRSSACFTLQPEWFHRLIKYFTWPDEKVEQWMARTGSDWEASRQRGLRVLAIRRKYGEL